MNSENTITIRNSFSIDNILSKPHKNHSTDNQYKSESGTECAENNNTIDEVSSVTSNEIVFKKEPSNGLINDEHLIAHDDLANVNRNQFTSPDSSGCEEENGDNLSDITNGDNRKCSHRMGIR